MKTPNLEDYVVKPGEKVKLADIDADEKLEMGKTMAKIEFLGITNELDHLQTLMYAEQRHKLLVVLQARNAGGKDGTIRSVFGPLNPQGVKVHGFKKPTDEELAHDYLWRVHQEMPQTGEIAVFNRSHYEDVLPVRVYGLVPKEVWSKRYKHIKDFERMLTDEGTQILKFYLHIDKDEQQERFQERLDLPRKQWKFNRGDLEDRSNWDVYDKAFEDAIKKTSTEYAPWHIIPANRNWVRNYLVGSIVKEKLESLGMQYPEPEEGLDQITLS